MTVKQAFEKAFGPIPEGATCHIGCRDMYTNIEVDACYRHIGETFFLNVHNKFVRFCDHFAFGPDISHRPASAFLGFFGGEYDRVVEEWIESQNEKHN
jgi:hypothetical protein